MWLGLFLAVLIHYFSTSVNNFNIYFCNFADVVILVTVVEAVKCVPTPVGGPEVHICAHAMALILGTLVFANNGVEHLFKNVSYARRIIELLKFFQ